MPAAQPAAPDPSTASANLPRASFGDVSRQLPDLVRCTFSRDELRAMQQRVNDFVGRAAELLRLERDAELAAEFGPAGSAASARVSTTKVKSGGGGNGEEGEEEGDGEAEEEVEGEGWMEAEARMARQEAEEGSILKGLLAVSTVAGERYCTLFASTNAGTHSDNPPASPVTLCAGRQLCV